MFTPVLLATGYSGFRLLKETEDAQRAALSESAEVTREVEYARENLAAVFTSDDLLADRRLLEVALTAYGLEDQLGNTAFIKQVLDGGVDDDNSFANRLNDDRWVEFSRDFGFGDTGGAADASGFRAVVETRFRNAEAEADAGLDPFALSHFRANIGSVASVDDLLADTLTLDVALAAFGLERGYYTDDHFRQLLTDGVDNPATDYAYSLETTAWVSFATAFVGLADGQPLETVTPFRLDVEREIERRGVTIYDQDEADASTTRIGAADLTHFQTNADSVATGAALVADSQLREVTLAAYGLAGTTLSDSAIATMLDSAISGDFTAAEAQSDTAWSQLARSFAASVNGGAAAEKPNFQYVIELGIADEGLERLASLEPDDNTISDVDAEDLAYFSAEIEKIDSIDDFLDDERLLTVALAAFGLEDEGKSTSYIKEVLEEDPEDATAFVNQLSDTRWANFSRAFNGVGSQTAIWQDEIERRLAEREAPQEDIDYLRANWNIVDENLDFVLLPELMDIVLSAFDIPKDTVSSEFFISMMISDPADDNSLVNLIDDDRWRDAVGLMGSLANTGGNTDDAGFREELIDRYENKRFEIAIGDQDQAMRLALNFERTISNYTDKDNWFLILADEPLRRVLDRALGMPEGFINMEIEDQNDAYADRARALFGGSTPEVFEDAEKISDALRRYMIAEEIAAQPGAGLPGYNALTMLQVAAQNARTGFGRF